MGKPYVDRRNPKLKIASRTLALLMSSLIGLPQVAASRMVHPYAEYQPTISLNTDGDVCEAFHASWIEAFNQPGDLANPSISEHLNAEVLEPIENSLVHDLDGDGTPEYLRVEEQTIGWRYLGHAVFVFRSKEDYLAAKRSYSSDDQKAHFFLRSPGTLERVKPQPLGSYSPRSNFQLFDIEGRIYATSGPSGSRRGTSVTLDLIKPAAGETVCEVQLLPSAADLQPAYETLGIAEPIESIYGGPGNCPQGTMHWGYQASPASTRMPTMLFRPQALEHLRSKWGDHSRLQGINLDSALQLRLAMWGIEDPTSWKEYLALKERTQGFLAYLESHYLRGQTRDPAQARQWALDAYHYWLEQLIYNWYYDSFRLTRVAYEPTSKLDFNPFTVPDELLSPTIELLEDTYEKPTRNSVIRAPINTFEIWSDAVLLAIYTGEADETLDKLWRKFDEEARKESRSDEHYEAAKSKTLLNMLIASLHDEDLLALVVSKGAKVNDKTNSYGKTALMYAAQHDYIGAVRQLLAAGANVNMATESSYCPRLDRDHRTAIMYAAENASLPLVELLLENGADPCARDSQQNSILFYASRNRHDPDVIGEISSNVYACYQ